MADELSDPLAVFTPEDLRLLEEREGGVPWKRWGPYLAERQWGTVREDYSESGDAWQAFTHDEARSRAYRWGEDGLLGISDDKQRLCFAFALWNGQDAILKERLFGLTNGEGNHGEDVKEYYYYLDSAPTHTYMKALYRYPQAAFPYGRLVRENAARSRHDLEYELIDTGVFDDDRYFDVFVEYAKEAPDDILIRVTVHNRGQAPAPLHLLPTLWFRNTWAWDGQLEGRPELHARGRAAVEARHPGLGHMILQLDGEAPILVTCNETNATRLSGAPNPAPFVKDGIHDAVVHGRLDAVDPSGAGTKAAFHLQHDVPPGEPWVVRLRLTAAGALPPSGYPGGSPFGEHFDTVIARRVAETDAYYDGITPGGVNDDERLVMRQALAGLLWTKQYYYLDQDRWLREHGSHPLFDPVDAPDARNASWAHMVCDDVVSMPDKWEYPWYAAWDLAFHTVALSMVDPGFSRRQLELLLDDPYLHPSGQLPAYEWNFSDVNPPVHAWATLFNYHVAKQTGYADVAFLKGAFQRLLLNFTWWVNRKDPLGRNVFEGGFLGLDNIGVFDRSRPLPTGGRLEQADGTAWMAFFAQNMLEIAAELACNDPAYEPMGMKFIQHYLWIAAAMFRMGDGHDGMWDDEDGFFYDILRLPDNRGVRLRVRSLVGLLPLCATTVFEASYLDRFPETRRRVRSFIERHPDLMANVHSLLQPGVEGRRLFSILDETRLRRVLTRMLDEEEFLGQYGVRSLSRYHLDHPYGFAVDGADYTVRYMPAESDSGMFGGNSNWRGPVWMPVNLLIVRALLQYYAYYGDSFRIECPTGSGREMTLFEVAREVARRLTAIFLQGADGRRPVFGGAAKFQDDPLWRDHLLFYEYFHGDNGAGLGASHQTGWTATVARLIQLFGHLEPADILRSGMRPVNLAYRR